MKNIIITSTLILSSVIMFQGDALAGACCGKEANAAIQERDFYPTDVDQLDLSQIPNVPAPQQDLGDLDPVNPVPQDDISSQDLGDLDPINPVPQDDISSQDSGDLEPVHHDIHDLGNIGQVHPVPQDDLDLQQGIIQVIQPIENIEDMQIDFENVPFADLQQPLHDVITVDSFAPSDNDTDTASQNS
ncbi:MAG: hypothetical protein C4617_05765 [Candidatus Liberibacter europaeus]|uniref:Secreted protein n=1 Tax=Candidatus Liberibacter europaeus TaxID=744859 RepID=A0A2T4VWA5_9HYPH|nr:hypothetical protein [Candidatus Liberibacter europaeus]PTL86058.1 MAG: hypothetical protein C4617_05765 [Candidatus Liberibacter europaeus]